jgi:hypothetical protein
MIALRRLPRFAVAWLAAGACTPAEPAAAPAPVVAEFRPPPAVAPVASEAAPTKAPPPAKAPTVAAPAAPAKAPAVERPVVFFRSAGESRGRAWRLVRGGSRRLAPTVDLNNGGTMGMGSTRPLLSPDGRWLAYLDRRRLRVADLDGREKLQRVTEDREISMLLSGFTPDSSALFFHASEIFGMEGSEHPLPPGLDAGFHRLRLEAREREALPSLSSFEAFTHDGRVLYFAEQDRTTRLMQVELGGEPRELQSTTMPYGYSQISVAGDRIAYVRHPSSGISQVVASRLDGSDLVELGPQGKFAQLQWPMITPDGTRVAYIDVNHVSPSVSRYTVMLVSLADRTPRELFLCADYCTHAWWSSSTLLVHDDRDLVQIGLDGTNDVIEEEVVGFVVAGAHG